MKISIEQDGENSVAYLIVMSHRADLDYLTQPCDIRLQTTSLELLILILLRGIPTHYQK